MTSDPVVAIQEIYRAAVAAVQPRTVLGRAINREGNLLRVGERQYDLDSQPVYALAFGKAGGEMLAEVESILRDELVDGLAIVKSVRHGLGLRSRVVQGSHPVPNQQSLKAGDEALRFANEVPDGALVICLISGGGSALMEALRPGVSLDDLQQVTRALLRAGATIHELNSVRARLSAIKAGGLLAAFGQVDVANIVISDVLGDDLATIASGPTVPTQDLERAEDVLERYGVSYQLPERSDTTSPTMPTTIIAGNLSLAIDAAAEQASDLGYQPVVLSRSVGGEARHVATAIAAILADSSAGYTAFATGTCLIAGGETTVTVQGDGLGGRNTEAALAAAIRLSGVDGAAMGFLATDGDDAETGVAGGIVTGATIDPAHLASARRALADNDSFPCLERAGAAWGLGPTGTNVNDLVIAIVA